MNVHDHSNSTLNSELPQRLLHISEDHVKTKVRLVSLADIKHGNIQYTALSYCWGSVQAHKTTKARIDAYSECIGMKDIPKTIQDAVEITLKLNYSYMYPWGFYRYRPRCTETDTIPPHSDRSGARRLVPNSPWTCARGKFPSKQIPTAIPTRSTSPHSGLYKSTCFLHASSAILTANSASSAATPPTKHLPAMSTAGRFYLSTMKPTSGSILLSSPRLKQSA